MLCCTKQTVVVNIYTCIYYTHIYILYIYPCIVIVYTHIYPCVFYTHIYTYTHVYYTIHTYTYYMHTHVQLQYAHTYTHVYTIHTYTHIHLYTHVYAIHICTCSYMSAHVVIHETLFILTNSSSFLSLHLQMVKKPTSGLTTFIIIVHLQNGSLYLTDVCVSCCCVHMYAYTT